MINYDIVDKLAEKNSNLFFIVVGAMDGIKHDNLAPYIIKNKLSGLFIEPIPDMFELLKKNYENHGAKILFENCAITNIEGEVLMYRVPIDQVGVLYPEWADGCSTIYPEKNAMKHLSPVQVKVKSKTFETVLNEHGIKSFDILQIDAEGADYIIFQSIDFNKFRPKFIIIEIMNLSNDDVNSIKTKLIKNNYVYTIIDDLLAIDQNCLKELN